MSADGGSAHSFDTGLTYMLTDNLQLDGAVGFGLSDEADDWFMTFGVSYRFPFRRHRDEGPAVVSEYDRSDMPGTR